MKIVNGRIKLEKRDTRVGNFVYTDEGEHIKIQDINLTITHRINKRIAKGQLLEMMLTEKEEHKNDLHNYATLMYNLLCTVPDAQFYEDINTAVLACVNRHKDIYGIKADIGKEEDDAIVKEEKDLHEAVSDIVEKAGEVPESEPGQAE